MLQQTSYLRLDNVTLDYDRSLTNASFSVGTTEDGNSGLFNFDLFYLDDVIKQQIRYKLSLAANSEDDKYSLLFLATTVDVCKIDGGVQTNIITRIVMENFLKSANFKRYKCPFIKNFWYTVKNCVITDHFIPPMLFEKKFMLEAKIYGMFQKQKGWKYTFKITIFGRFKK